jgi:hypothetical protein
MLNDFHHVRDDIHNHSPHDYKNVHGGDIHIDVPRVYVRDDNMIRVPRGDARDDVLHHDDNNIYVHDDYVLNNNLIYDFYSFLPLQNMFFSN